MPLAVIVDNSVLPVAGTISEDPWAYSYNGTSLRLEAGQSFDYEYHGRAMFIYGPTSGAAAEIEVDNQEKIVQYFSPPDGRPKLANGFVGWSGQFDDGRGDNLKHLMKYTVLQGVDEIDFFLYEPSSLWSVAGNTLLLDDQDEWVIFSGSWNSTSRSNTNGNTTFSTGNAVKQTISQTRTAGSTFKAGFVGSNIQVYGALQQVPGNVTFDYHIDKNFLGTVTLSHSAHEANDTNWELNRRLIDFSNPLFYGDEDAEHTLEVIVKEVTGDQMFSFDYLTFEGTRWTNVTSPGSALASPFPEPGSGSFTKRKIAIGLGVSLPLALIIGVGLFFIFKRRKSAKGL